MNERLEIDLSLAKTAGSSDSILSSGLITATSKAYATYFINRGRFIIFNVETLINGRT